ncbi:universal stress protein [Geovibrio thiophilus]|uniref:Universal stress protein n=1 Tax=Geovibrio thiophilus TaxID=139438 RepID=A0A410JZB4_9BACT|nr:universal stress protein [Geovibrio thiophilus]QAR33368.1 universal stress protein [Geovibrio thiophilus]
MFKPKRILVPTDFSSSARVAIQQAKEIAEQYNSELVIIHVKAKEAENLPLFFLDDSKIEEINKHLDEHIDHEIEKIRKEIFSGSIVKPTVRVCHGNPYDEIIKTADSMACDLIVISSKGKSSLDGFFFGSITEKVARRAHCSVLISR